MAKKSNDDGNTKLIKILFVLIVLAMIGVGYMVFHLLNKGDISSLKEKETTEVQPETLVSLDEFTLQLTDGHYAKLSINLGAVGKDDAIAEINKQKPVLRDKVITEMMKLNQEDLSVQNLEITKNILKDALTPLLSEAEVQSVYFDNLIVQ